ncbi:MAG: hydroxyphenylacetyl-CoA thioesterase PaaI [Pseudomonadota bacterium]
MTDAPDPAALALATACAEALWRSDAATRKLGMAYTVLQPGAVDMTMQVTADMTNGHGTCHGGFVFALADSAFAFACNAYNQVTVAAGASIDYLRPALEGDTLVAAARERRRGRRTGVYDVTVTNKDGATIALFRGRAAITSKPVLPST